MLAIRMQRTGRKGHASFRVVVQDSRQSPVSGKVVAQLGNYDPHTKVATLIKDRAEFYLERGAHPSDRTAQLFKKEGVKLPAWVEASTKKSSAIRHPAKLRRNRPDEPVAPEAPVDEAPAAEEVPAEEAPAEEVAVAETTEVETDAATPETAEAEPAKATTEPVEADAEPEAPAEPVTDEVTAETSPDEPIDTPEPAAADDNKSEKPAT